MLNADKKKIILFSNKEILTLFFIFIAVLYFLYPKDLMRNLILSENSNYDLTMVYLKDLLKLEPKNRMIMFETAKIAIRQGKVVMADRILETLENTNDNTLVAKIYPLRYELLKQEFILRHAKSKQNTLNKLKKVLHAIVQKHYFGTHKYMFWFKEAMFAKSYGDALQISRFALNKMPHDVIWLKAGFSAALQQKKEKDIIWYLTQLLTYDYRHKRNWRKRLADYYLSKKQYVKSSDTYLAGFDASTSYPRKRYYFIKAVNVLMWGKKYSKAVSIAKKYEKLFLKDDKMTNWILKLYLAAGRTDEAARLSKIILHRCRGI